VKPPDGDAIGTTGHVVAGGDDDLDWDGFHGIMGRGRIGFMNP
jgi:hypothetical protein